MEFTNDEQKELASFGLLTRKPILTVFNMGEGQPAPEGKLDHPAVALMGKLEMEIAQLSADDAAVFMEEYGIKELSLNRMINLSYDLLAKKADKETPHITHRALVKCRDSHCEYHH